MEKDIPGKKIKQTMTKKERVLNALQHRKIDRIPWTMYASYPPWSETELGLRNRGLTLIYQHFPVCRVSMDNVEVLESNKYFLNNYKGRNVINRIFKTPVGSVTVTHEFVIDSLPSPGDLIQYFGSNIDQESLSWVTAFPLKDESDYDVIEFIYKNTHFKLNDVEYIRTEKIIGNEGIIFGIMGKSPFQILLYELMGAERCYLEHHSNPKKFNKLYELLYAKQKEKYLVASESSAKIFWAPENLTGTLTPPHFFKEYYIPFYDEMADILHKKDKLLAVHMDGMLSSLAGLIKDTKIDIIEAFTPPPMGNISVSKAMRMWGDKVIWINFPGTLLASSNFDEIENYTISMIKSIAPGDNFLIGCTENYPVERWHEAFGAIASAIDKAGNYPVK